MVNQSIFLLSSVKLASKDLFWYAGKTHYLYIPIQAVQNHNAVNIANAKLSWTARIPQVSDWHLNHRLTKTGRDTWKSLVNHMIKPELTSKLHEAAQGLVQGSFDFIKEWRIHHLPVYMIQCLTSSLTSKQKKKNLENKQKNPSPHQKNRIMDDTKQKFC